MTDIIALQRSNRLQLHPEATEMMLTALESVYRYNNYPVISEAYKINVRTHVQHVTDDVTRIIAETVPDDVPIPACLAKTIPDVNLKDALIIAAAKPVAVHDFDEVVTEAVTAKGETDPTLQLALANAKPGDFAEEVTNFFFRLALFATQQNKPDIFYSYLQDVRDNAKVQKNGFGLEDNSTQGMLDYYKTVRTMMKPEIFDKSIRLKQWNDVPARKSVEQMRYHYNLIEGQNVKANFIGLFAKAAEKHDGTHYAVHVNTLRLHAGEKTDLMHQRPQTEQPLVNSRYEKLLSVMQQQAHDEKTPVLKDAYLAITQKFIRTSYETSRETFKQGPSEIIYKNKNHYADTIIARYDDILGSHIITPKPGIVLDYI